MQVAPGRGVLRDRERPRQPLLQPLPPPSGLVRGLLGGPRSHQRRAAPEPGARLVHRLADQGQAAVRADQIKQIAPLACRRIGPTPRIAFRMRQKYSEFPRDPVRVPDLPKGAVPPPLQRVVPTDRLGLPGEGVPDLPRAPAPLPLRPFASEVGAV